MILSVKINRNASVAVFLRGIGAILAFITNVFIARKLGGDETSIYFISMSITIVLSAVARLGMEIPMLKQTSFAHASGDVSSASNNFEAMLFVVGTSSAFLALITYLLAPVVSNKIFGNPNLKLPLMAISPSIIFYSLWMLCAFALQGIGKVLPLMLVSSIIFPALFASLSLLLVFPYGALGVTIAYMIATGITFILCYILWAIAVPRTPFRIKLAEVQLMVRLGLRNWLLIVLNEAILPWGPIFLLGVWSTKLDVSVFGAATRVTTAIALICAAATTALAPRISALLEAGDYAELKVFLRRVSFWMILMTSPIFIIVTLFSENVMGIFGSDFRVGASTLLVLALGKFSQAASGASSIVLAIGGFEKDLFWLSIFAVCFLMVVLFMLVPSLGSVGAAVAVGCTTLILSLTPILLIRLRFPQGVE